MNLQLGYFDRMYIKKGSIELSSRSISVLGK